MEERALKYVKDLLKQGYSPAVIKQQLQQSNYSASEIEALFSQATGYKNSTLSIVIISVVVLALVIGAIIWYVSSIPPSFNISVIPDKQTYTAGEALTFKVSMNPSGYDVLLAYTLTDTLTKSQAISSQETAQTGVKNTILSIPSDLRAGNYELTVSMTYSGKTASAKSNIQINALPEEQKTAISSAKPTAVESVCGSCDDYNACTTDTCVKGTCEYTEITPCCGNNVCEASESSSCADCKTSGTPTSSGDVESAKAKAKSDAVGASQICAGIPQTSEADRCYTEISQIADESSLCAPIQEQIARDSCYIEFAFKNDNSVCPKIVDNYLQLSCYNLFNIK